MLINFSMDAVPDGTDERYNTRPADGACRNRYCPEPTGRYDALVRGYCEPCASIRVPPSEYRPDSRQAGDDWNTISNLTHRCD